MTRPRARTSRAGVTIVELMLALGLLSLVTVVAIYGWGFILRGERRNSTQCELDIDVRTAIERLRSELRLSTVDKMVFHPPGPGPYQAISFPLAQDLDHDGLVDMDANGTNILWRQTVIYHIARGEPDKLLRTVFSPRDNSLSPTERAEQLASVVLAGDGGSAANGVNASTRVIFANFFDWSIEAKSSTYDAYAPTLSRRPVMFGSALLSSGDHSYTFTLVNKHNSSTGYKLGLDTLRVSAAASDLEAEDRTVISGSVVRQYLAEGSWSDNHQLLFDPGTAVGGPSMVLSIPSDRWEDPALRTPLATLVRTVNVFNTSANDYLIQLEGNGAAWSAANQTGTAMPSEPVNNFKGHAVRVLLKGDTDAMVGYIDYDGRITMDGTGGPGGRPCLRLRIPTDMSLASPYASIGEADPAGFATLNARAGTMKPLFLTRPNSSSDLVLGIVGAGTAIAPVPIWHTNSYVVSFVVNPFSSGLGLPRWTNSRNTVTSTIAITNGVPSDLAALSWAGRPGFRSFPDIYGVESLTTAYPSDGYYTSEIFDTTVAAPDYSFAEWDAQMPSQSALEIRARSGNMPDLSDAVAWSSAAVLSNGGSLSGAGHGRYLQFRARLASDSLGRGTPKLSRVAFEWPAETRLVDISGVVTYGPDYGAFELKVDGKPLIKGLRVSLAIFKDIPALGARMTSSMTMEVEPRNTGK